MHRRMTITLDEVVYEGLYRTVGKRRMSQFIEDLLRPHVVDTSLEWLPGDGYRQGARSRSDGVVQRSCRRHGRLNAVKCGGLSLARQSAARYARPVRQSSLATTRPTGIWRGWWLCRCPATLGGSTPARRWWRSAGRAARQWPTRSGLPTRRGSKTRLVLYPKPICWPLRTRLRFIWRYLGSAILSPTAQRGMSWLKRPETTVFWPQSSG